MASTLTAPAERSTPTPWQLHAGIYCKRDDLYEYGGVRGGKVRTCRAIAEAGVAAGRRGLVTAGSRSSPQVNIVAHVGAHLDVPVTAFVPSGPPGQEVTAARRAGAQVLPVRPGHNSVITARARAYAEQRGWCLIPFGMEHHAAVEAAAGAVAAGGPWGTISRLVVPVGSGMTLAGVLHGLERAEVVVPVLGVVVGAAPEGRLDRWAPPLWRFSAELVRSELRYSAEAPAGWQQALGFALDPVYEAKCMPHLRPGDGLWCVGHRGVAVAHG